MRGVDPDRGGPLESAQGGASGRPLVVHFGALGDTVMLTVLLRALGARWGRPCDVVGSRGAPRQVLAGLDFVGEIVTIKSRRRPYPLGPDQWRLVRWLRRRGPSPSYVVEEELPKVGWLLQRGGVPRGHRLEPGDLPRGDLEHAVDYYRRLGRSLPPRYPGTPAGPPPEDGGGPVLAVTGQERAECVRWLEGLGWDGRPLVLFQTQSRRRKRGRWPTAKWVAAVRGVLDDLPEAWALLIGAPDEAAGIEELRRACGDPRVREVARELGLRRLFALATLAHSAVSLDTGPAHVLAVLECPVAVLTGQADPRRNRPLGPAARVQVVTSLPEERWPPTRAEWEATHRMEEIEVADVLGAWRRLEHRCAAPR